VPARILAEGRQDINPLSGQSAAEDKA